MVADELGMQVGQYTHFAHDLHIYERHWHMKEKYYFSQETPEQANS